MDNPLDLFHSAPENGFTNSAWNQNQEQWHQQHQQQQPQPSPSFQEQDPAIVAATPASIACHCHLCHDLTSDTSSPRTEPFPEIDPVPLHDSFLSDGGQPLPLPYFAVAHQQPYPNALTYTVLPPFGMQVPSSGFAFQPQPQPFQVQGVQGPIVAPWLPGYQAMIPPGWPFPGVDMRHANFGSADEDMRTTNNQHHTMNNGGNNNGFGNNTFGANAPVPGQHQTNVAGQMNQQFGYQGHQGQAMPGDRRRDPALDFKRSETSFTQPQFNNANANANGHFTAIHSNGAGGPPANRPSTYPAPYDFHFTEELGLHPFPTPAEVYARQVAEANRQGQANGQANGPAQGHGQTHHRGNARGRGNGRNRGQARAQNYQAQRGQTRQHQAQRGQAQRGQAQRGQAQHHQAQPQQAQYQTHHGQAYPQTHQGQAHPQMNTMPQPTAQMNQFPQTNIVHQQNGHGHGHMGQGQGQGQGQGYMAPNGGMMMTQNFAAPHANNTSMMHNSNASNNSAQPMMSPAFPSSPLPVQYYRQQSAPMPMPPPQHQAYQPRGQQGNNTNFNGGVVNHGSRPQGITQNNNFNGAPVNHNSQPRVSQTTSTTTALVARANHLIENPRTRPFVELRISELTHSEEWASKYRFHVEAVPPFIDLTRYVAPSAKPVIVIKNIPYTITQNEIQQFLGKSLLPHSLTYLSGPGTASLPIYIIMERGTGKTQDCFVELPSAEIAADCIERVENLIMANKPPKMAQRIVTVEMSCQGELMRELFPHAKNINWDAATGIPIMRTPTDGYGAGFRGFLSGEELNNVVRFAEMPQRSPFVIRCQQRTYEMTISTLLKFPWASVYYTLEHRDRLFKAYLNQLAALLPKVFTEEYGNHRSQRVVGLDARLVASFVDAGLDCPGFSEAQKALVLDITNQCYPYRGISHYGAAWPFEALTKPEGVGDYEIALWLEIMRIGTEVAMLHDDPLAVGTDGKPIVDITFDQWGQLMTRVSEEGRKSISFADLARMEKKLLKCMLFYGFWACFGRTGGNLYAWLEEIKLSKVEKKMRRLGAFKVRHGPSRNLCIASKGEQPTATNGTTSQTQGQLIPFEEPIHGRDMSIATDSGAGDMHRTMNMQVLVDEVNAMAKDVNFGATSDAARAPGPRPNYAGALGNILVNTEKANAPNRLRAAPKMIPIKSPDGQVLTFSSSVNNNNNNNNNKGKSLSQDAGSYIATPKHHRAESVLGPIGTPSRRLIQSSAVMSTPGSEKTIRPIGTSSCRSTPGNGSATPRAGKVLESKGTPSRRPIQGNTVAVGDDIDEETDDDSILMQGRRFQGVSLSGARF